MDLQYLLALISGGFVGLLLGATGGGGSLVAIPLLVYVVGVPVQKSTAMSLIVVGYSALFGAWKEHQRQRVHTKAALLFSLTGMIGAWIGAQGHQLVPTALLHQDTAVEHENPVNVAQATEPVRNHNHGLVREPLAQAAVRGTQQIMTPVLATVMTTVPATANGNRM